MLVNKKSKYDKIKIFYPNETIKTVMYHDSIIIYLIINKLHLQKTTIKNDERKSDKFIYVYFRIR